MLADNIPLDMISFNNSKEYAKLELALKNTSNFEEVNVDKPYASVGLEEHWYLNKETGDIWRLVRPDPPFGGGWCKV